MRVCLALDIGGTKVAAGLVSEAGDLSGQGQVPTPAGDDPEVLWEAVAGLVATVVGKGAAAGMPEPVACGVGSVAPMTPGGEMVYPVNVPAWNGGFPLRARLEGLPELARVPLFVDVDAKALALGEGWLGAAAGRPNFLAMVVSTGVGGGLVLGGEAVDGRTGNAGHVGHVIVVPGGRVCGCGARGCLEAEASGTAIAALTGRPPAEAPPPMVARTGTLVGRAVASVANLVDLDLAVVAGSVALGYGAPFFAAAQAELDALARLSFSAGARIVPAGLGPAGPLVGAAALAWRGLRS
ncbi:MAG: ROK family protein [Acidimicrobiales bacterium]